MSQSTSITSISVEFSPQYDSFCPLNVSAHVLKQLRCFYNFCFFWFNKFGDVTQFLIGWATPFQYSPKYAQCTHKLREALLQMPPLLFGRCPFGGEGCKCLPEWSWTNSFLIIFAGQVKTLVRIILISPLCILTCRRVNKEKCFHSPKN